MAQSNDEVLQHTNLYSWHKQNGGKLVSFAGWEMPVQYAGLREEHNAVRNAAGLFDVSHMGEIRVKGVHALKSVQWFTTNDASKLKAGQAQYSLFPNTQGGVVDDLIVYCVTPETDYLLCVNASNKEKDLAFVLSQNQGADIVDESSKWGQIALHGPKAMDILSKALGDQFKDLLGFHFKIISWKGIELWVARTGYTGEPGVEIFVPWAETENLWVHLLAQGEKEGLVPCGLGARDTLRTEMKYPLYGQEIDDHTNPYAAGLGWVVKPQAKDFLSKELILAAKAKVDQKLVGIVLEDKGIARQGYPVFSSDDLEIGKVTSGTLSPTLNQAIAVAFVKIPWTEVGTELFVDIRGRKARAKVVTTPFVKPQA